MPDRVDNLTPEQIARFPEWVEKWTKVGLCCDPADWATFERAAIACYRWAGLAAPQRIVRVGSPIVAAISGSLAANFLNRRDAARDAVQVAVSDAVRDAVRDAVSGAVSGAVHGAVRDAVRDAVGAAVGVAVGVAVGDADAVRDAVHGAVRDAVGAAVGVAVGVAVGDAVGDADAVRGAVGVGGGGAIGGAFWISWQAYESFFREVCGLSHNKIAQAVDYCEAQSSVGWWWPHAEFIVVSDRPQHLKFDELGRGHCDDGPASLWRDGWSIWMINGVLVDEQIVMRPESQTVQQIAQEVNEEVRRIRIERFGWERYLREAGAVTTHRRFNDRDQQWEELKVLSDGTRRILLCDPSTGRKYALGVPREIKNCEAAQAWLSHGLDRRAIHRS